MVNPLIFIKYIYWICERNGLKFSWDVGYPYVYIIKQLFFFDKHLKFDVWV